MIGERGQDDDLTLRQEPGKEEEEEAKRAVVFGGLLLLWRRNDSLCALDVCSISWRTVDSQPT